MRKIFIILTTILFSCSNNDDNCDVEMDVDDIEKSITYYIELNNSTTRVGFNQITLPGYVFSPTSQQQTFKLDQGMSGGVNDVRVTLSGKCSLGNSNVNKEIFVNFLEDKPTVVFFYFKSCLLFT